MSKTLLKPSGLLSRGAGYRQLPFNSVLGAWHFCKSGHIYIIATSLSSEPVLLVSKQAIWFLPAQSVLCELLLPIAHRDAVRSYRSIICWNILAHTKAELTSPLSKAWCFSVFLFKMVWVVPQFPLNPGRGGRGDLANTDIFLQLEMAFSFLTLLPLLYSERGTDQNTEVTSVLSVCCFTGTMDIKQ